MRALAPAPALALAMALALVGNIQLDSDAGTSTTHASTVLVPMGALASGSSGGLNGTAGTATITGTLVSTTTNALYLNNTDSAVWYAKLDVASSSGLANLPALTIGINNGTSSVAQTTVLVAALTKSTGTYVRLEPSSTNRIYVTDTVTTLGLTSSFTLTVRASVDTSESVGFVDTTATITIH